MKIQAGIPYASSPKFGRRLRENETEELKGLLKQMPHLGEQVLANFRPELVAVVDNARAGRRFRVKSAPGKFADTVRIIGTYIAYRLRGVYKVDKSGANPFFAVQWFKFEPPHVEWYQKLRFKPRDLDMPNRKAIGNNFIEIFRLD